MKETNMSKYKSIRVKTTTKLLIDKFLEKINKPEDSGKISPDRLITYFLENVTNEEIKKMQQSTVTWKIEEPRLIRLWSKKNGNITGDKWKEMLYMGQLQGFIKEHSRIAI